jgi:hypothetical protein
MHAVSRDIVSGCGSLSVPEGEKGEQREQNTEKEQKEQIRPRKARDYFSVWGIGSGGKAARKTADKRYGCRSVYHRPIPLFSKNSVLSHFRYIYTKYIIYLSGNQYNSRYTNGRFSA